jgi:hypothetical protein
MDAKRVSLMEATEAQRVRADQSFPRTEFRGSPAAGALRVGFEAALAGGANRTLRAIVTCPLSLLQVSAGSTIAAASLVMRRGTSLVRARALQLFVCVTWCTMVCVRICMRTCALAA